jgi:hypothetical protein
LKVYRFYDIVVELYSVFFGACGDIAMKHFNVVVKREDECHEWKTYSVEVSGR